MSIWEGVQLVVLSIWILCVMGAVGLSVYVRRSHRILNRETNKQFARRQRALQWKEPLWDFVIGTSIIGLALYAVSVLLDFA